MALTIRYRQRSVVAPWDWDLKLDRRSAAKAAEEVQRTSVVTPLGLLGFYMLRRDEAFLGRPWDGEHAREVWRDLFELVSREGLETAWTAIDVIFTDDFRWMDSQRSRVLARANTYDQFVLAKVVARKRRGEQSEWRGTKDETPGCVEVEI